jgi:hypothetical protein
MITRADIERTIKKFPDYPQIEDLLPDDELTTLVCDFCCELLKLTARKTEKPSTKNIHGTFRARFEFFAREIGYLSKAHMLVAYDVLGYTITGADDYYYSVNVAVTKDTEIRRDMRVSFLTTPVDSGVLQELIDMYTERANRMKGKYPKALA